MTGTAQIIRGNALDLPLADASVDLIVTSPPYFGLRSYQDGGEHYAGQLGSEATPAEFVDALIAATREMVRVLKPSGSIWVNLGDKYSGQAPGPQGGSSITSGRGWDHGERAQYTTCIRPKSLIGIPWRYAIRCIDELGLILRAEVIWSKPNGLPESVTDRVRRSHEQWFYFEQSGSVEPLAEGLPLCDLCGRPVDARSTLVARLKEVDGAAESVRVPDHVGQDDWREIADSGSSHHDMAVGSLVPAVPSVGVGDTERIEQSVELVEDLVAAAVDRNSEDGAPGLSADEGDRALSVDESGKPSGVCECERHALTLNDEPWIPQSLAAELMQMVADGTADAQNVADFLSGDYARTHSTWFHFTVSPRYFSAVDEIREEQTSLTLSRSDRGGAGKHSRIDPAKADQDGIERTWASNPLGKLPGSVWTVPTQPLKVPEHLGVDHFAAFPMEWPRRIIRGWSPSGICVECGEGRRPVSERQSAGRDRSTTAAKDPSWQAINRADWQEGVTRIITGEVCECPDPTAPTRPAVVLDPFGGTGTTALVAKALGRHGISNDMSADYCRLAQWRTTDEGELARALEVDKPAQQVEGQASLLDLIAEEAS